MILILQKGASQEQIADICTHLQGMQLTGQPIQSGGITVIAVQEDVSTVPGHLFSKLPGVEKVIRTQGQASLAANAAVPPLEFSDGTRLGTSAPPVVIAGGADGLIIEVHDEPQNALSDGEQAVHSDTLRDIVRDCQAIHAALKQAAQALPI